MQTEATADPGRRLIPTATPGIYKRGARYVVRFRDSAGRQRQRAAGTLAEARRVRSEVNADVSRGEYRPDTKVSFTTYATTWAEHYTGRSARGLRAETLADYLRDLKPALDYFGRRRLAEITPADMKSYARALADQGLAPATVRRRLAPVKAMFATAVEEGLIRSNPTLGVRLGVVSADTGPVEEPVKVLAPEEAARLMQAVPEGWQRLLVRLLLATGLRISEGLGLRWTDVDLAERRVRVRQRVRQGQAGAPKSRAGVREVPISPSLVGMLREHYLASGRPEPEVPVFATTTGAPHHSSNLYRWWKPATVEAGVPWAGFHAMRHTAASRWLLSGVSIAQVARLLGHHDPGFTLRTYISVMPADLPDGETLALAVGLV